MRRHELAPFIELRNESSLEMKVEGTIDILFSDSDCRYREAEVRRFLPQVRPTGLVLMHDASSHMKTVREAAFKLEAEGLLSLRVSADAAGAGDCAAARGSGVGLQSARRCVVARFSEVGVR